MRHKTASWVPLDEMLFLRTGRKGLVGIPNIALNFPGPFYFLRYIHPLAVIHLGTIGAHDLVCSRAPARITHGLSRSDCNFDFRCAVRLYWT